MKGNKLRTAGAASYFLQATKDKAQAQSRLFEELCTYKEQEVAGAWQRKFVLFVRCMLCLVGREHNTKCDLLIQDWIAP
jgi:hypothetical protein